MQSWTKIVGTLSIFIIRWSHLFVMKDTKAHGVDNIIFLHLQNFAKTDRLVKTWDMYNSISFDWWKQIQINVSMQCKEESLLFPKHTSYKSKSALSCPATVVQPLVILLCRACPAAVRQTHPLQLCTMSLLFLKRGSISAQTQRTDKTVDAHKIQFPLHHIKVHHSFF